MGLALTTQEISNVRYSRQNKGRALVAEDWEMLCEPSRFTKESQMVRMKIGLIFAEAVGHICDDDTKFLISHYCGGRYGNHASYGIIRHESDIAKCLAGMAASIQHMDLAKIDDNVARCFSDFILQSLDYEHRITGLTGYSLEKAQLIAIFYRILFNKLRNPFEDL